MRNLWSSREGRSVIYQFIAASFVILSCYYFYSNTQANLDKRNIATGFDFLSQEAGFEISDTLIEYWSDDTYRKALWVGILNTFKVAFLGNIFALVLGLFIGVSRLSKNWLLGRCAQVYIEIVRNVPLLLQLFFWYAMFTEVFPAVKQAWEILPQTFLSQRGLVIPVFASHRAWSAIGMVLPFSIGASAFMWHWQNKKRERTGRESRFWPWPLLLIGGTSLLLWLGLGMPTELNLPVLRGFNFSGGIVFTPEYISLMLGLVVYTSAFIAEIVRAGILSVDKGQWEAGRALGLADRRIMRLIVLPQALRVIIPPLTSQVLNLVKNSSLAIGIGYPDFVAVANTSINQTGQAIELVALIMMVYLFFSLSISLFMNAYNKVMALKGESR